MNNVSFILIVFFISIPFSLNAKDTTQINNNKWANLNLYRVLNQRAGPYAYDDTYLELEFGGRYEWLDLYGYIDYLDVLNDSSSGKHNQDNFFVDIEPRISIDYLLRQDLSVGVIDEFFFAFDIYYADAPASMDKGLQLLWMGIGSNINIPWLGLCGVNLYARYIKNNYGAMNENSFDGYDAHINWFKPFYFLSKNKFVSFQGYSDYEFFSRMDDYNRASDSFQAYFGFWLHDEKWALGYGLKTYNNMTQWKDGKTFYGKDTDTSGFAHYFNVTYKF